MKPTHAHQDIYMYAYRCVYIYIHIHTHVHTLRDPHTNKYIYIYIHTHICVPGMRLPLPPAVSFPTALNTPPAWPGHAACCAPASRWPCLLRPAKVEASTETFGVPKRHINTRILQMMISAIPSWWALEPGCIGSLCLCRHLGPDGLWPKEPLEGMAAGARHLEHPLSPLKDSWLASAVRTWPMPGQRHWRMPREIVCGQTAKRDGMKDVHAEHPISLGEGTKGTCKHKRPTRHLFWYPPSFWALEPECEILMFMWSCGPCWYRSLQKQ